MAFLTMCNKTLLLTITSSLLLLPTATMAQEKVNMRFGTHEGYNRIVFDWSKKSGYNIRKTDSKLKIDFNKAGAVDTQFINSASLSNIGNVNITSSDPLSLYIDIKPKARFRHFSVGKKVIIDIYDSEGKVSKTSTPSATKTVSDATMPDSVKELKTDSSVKVDYIQKNDVEIQPLEGIEPHVITITSTQSVGMAAFERAGFLWLVFDNPNLKLSPVISGPKSDQFPALKKFVLENGMAFRLPKPENNYFYGEGGGLLWRVIMTPNPRNIEPIAPEVNEKSDTLNWPLKGIEQTLQMTDPIVGDTIMVSTVIDTAQYAGQPRQYVEVEALPSFIGLALVPKTDDITTAFDTETLSVTRPQGLALSSTKDIAPFVLKDDIQKEDERFAAQARPEISRVYNFQRWQMGGIHALEKNRRLILNNVGDKSGAQKVEDLLTLAKLNIANNRGQEALGLLKVAAEELPGIDENPEFIALRGAAATISGKYDEGFEDFIQPSLEEYGEIKYWKAYALAGLEDWRQADDVMPNNFDLVMEYPIQIRRPITLALSEVALRSAKTTMAQGLLASLSQDFKKMEPWQQAKWTYLSGELDRQLGKTDNALNRWKPLLKGRDDYFRAKAGLAVTRVELEDEMITADKAIDRLEGLRYAWRGDELETLINFRLGKVYIDDGEYLKGLSVLRNTVSLMPNSIGSQEVADYMKEEYRALFTEGKLADISALDAVSIFEEFKELTPVGKEGDVFVQNLAERLVDVDLLERAASLLEHQVDHRLEGQDATRVAIRLAAIRLLDNKPENALKALRAAERQAPGYKTREIKLLRARALSKLNRASEALRILQNMSKDNDVYRLLADIAWNANRWKDAAKAFDALIQEEGISLTRPMNDYQNSLVLNRAIALNLSGNRTALSKLRERYGDLMMQSDKARLFDLVTRPRQFGAIDNQNSIINLIAEVDMFGDFIESYRKIN